MVVAISECGLISVVICVLGCPSDDDLAVELKDSRDQVSHVPCEGCDSALMLHVRNVDDYIAAGCEDDVEARECRFDIVEVGFVRTFASVVLERISFVLLFHDRRRGKAARDRWEPR